MQITRLWRKCRLNSPRALENEGVRSLRGNSILVLVMKVSHKRVEKEWVAQRGPRQGEESPVCLAPGFSRPMIRNRTKNILIGQKKLYKLRCSDLWREIFGQWSDQ